MAIGGERYQNQVGLINWPNNISILNTLELDGAKAHGPILSATYGSGLWGLKVAQCVRIVLATTKTKGLDFCYIYLSEKCQ